MRICIHPFSGEEVLKMLQKSVLNPLEMPLRLGLESAGAARFWNNPSWKHLAISSNCLSIGIRAEDLSGLVFRSLVSAHYERDRTGCQQVREPEKWGLQTPSPAEQNGEGWARWERWQANIQDTRTVGRRYGNNPLCIMCMFNGKAILLSSSYLFHLKIHVGVNLIYLIWKFILLRSEN